MTSSKTTDLLEREDMAAVLTKCLILITYLDRAEKDAYRYETLMKSLLKVRDYLDPDFTARLTAHVRSEEYTDEPNPEK